MISTFSGRTPDGFEEKHHMPWTYEAYEAYELNFREDVVNAFHRLGYERLPPLRRSPSLEEGGLGGFAGQSLRPCRRLDIGALRSPL